MIGSFNYGLNTEESDIDTRMVVIPDFTVSNMRAGLRISKELAMPNCDEHCHIIDLISWVDSLKKGCITALEVLGSKYVVFDGYYSRSVFDSIKNQEKYFVHILKRNFIRAQIGYAVSQMRRNTPKSIMHGYRALHILDLAYKDKADLYTMTNLSKENAEALRLIRKQEIPAEELEKAIQEYDKEYSLLCCAETNKNDETHYEWLIDELIGNAYSHYWKIGA